MLLSIFVYCQTVMHVKYPNYTLETVQLFTGNVIYSPAAIHLCQNHELTTSVFTDRIRRHEDLLPNNQNMTKFKKRTSHGLY